MFESKRPDVSLLLYLFYSNENTVLVQRHNCVTANREEVSEEFSRVNLISISGAIAYHFRHFFPIYCIMFDVVSENHTPFTLL